MKPTLIKTLSILLVLSISLNGYLFVSKYKWKNAWLNQFLSTNEIESILKESNADISFTNIESLAKNRFGSGVEIVELTESNLHLGLDKKVIKVNETLLFFKNGIYSGSKANLPNH